MFIILTNLDFFSLCFPLQENKQYISVKSLDDTTRRLKDTSPLDILLPREIWIPAEVVDTPPGMAFTDGSIKMFLGGVVMQHSRHLKI